MTQRVHDFIEYLIEKGVANEKARTYEAFQEALDKIMENPILYADDGGKMGLLIDYYIEWCKKYDPLKNYNTTESVIGATIAGLISEEDANYRIGYILYITH